MVKEALKIQDKGVGFSFVEILTMCPTGWFIETAEAPECLDEHIEPTHRFGVIKSPVAAVKRQH